MPRRKRREEAGLVHHLCLHGVNGELIFRDDEDRIGFTLMLAATAVRFGWLVLAYCQMGTHIHLLIETPNANLGAGMQWLAGRYAQAFNKQHGRDTHLFGGRYYDRPVETEAHLFNVVGYIAGNPCAAGMCADPADWPWSSQSPLANGTAGEWLAHDRLLERLEFAAGTGAYEALVERAGTRAID